MPDQERLGYNWLQGFKKRHPEVKSAWARPLDKARYHGATKENTRNVSIM